MAIPYWSGSLHLVFACFEHIIAKEAECKVVIRSNDAGECGDKCDRVKEVLNYLRYVHFKLWIIVKLFIINNMDNKEDLITAQLAMLLGTKLDAKTKFKLLDMIDPRPIEVVGDIDPSAILTQEKLMNVIKG